MQPSEGSLYASPLAIPEGVLCATLDGWLAAIQPESGTVSWSLCLGHPLFTSPAYSPACQLLYVGCVNRTLYAVSAHQGAVVWQYATAAPIFSSPVLYDEHGVLFGCHDHSLYLLDAAEGRLVWRRDLDAEIFASPDFEAAGGRIVAATTKGDVHLVSNDGAVTQSFRPGGHLFSSPLFLPGQIILGSRDNFLYCYDEEVTGP